MMNLPHPAESLCLAHMAAEQAAGGSNEQLFLYIGLTSGVCERVSFARGYPAFLFCLAGDPPSCFPAAKLQGHRFVRYGKVPRP